KTNPIRSSLGKTVQGAIPFPVHAGRELCPFFAATLRLGIPHALLTGLVANGVVADRVQLLAEILLLAHPFGSSSCPRRLGRGGGAAFIPGVCGPPAFGVAGRGASFRDC